MYTWFVRQHCIQRCEQLLGKWKTNMSQWVMKRFPQLYSACCHFKWKGCKLIFQWSVHHECKTDCNTASWIINCSFCLRHRAFDANKQTKTCGEKMPYLIDPNKLKINKNAHRFDLIVFLFERINWHTAKAKGKTIIAFFLVKNVWNKWQHTSHQKRSRLFINHDYSTIIIHMR